MRRGHAVYVVDQVARGRSAHFSQSQGKVANGNLARTEQREVRGRRLVGRRDAHEAVDGEAMDVAAACDEGLGVGAVEEQRRVAVGIRELLLAHERVELRVGAAAVRDALRHAAPISMRES